MKKFHIIGKNNLISYAATHSVVSKIALGSACIILAGLIFFCIIAATNWHNGNTRLTNITNNLMALNSKSVTLLEDFNLVATTKPRVHCVNETTFLTGWQNQYSCASFIESGFIAKSATLTPDEVQVEVLSYLDSLKVTGYSGTYGSDSSGRDISSYLNEVGFYEALLTIPDSGYRGVSQTNLNNLNEPAGLADTNIDVYMINPSVYKKLDRIDSSNPSYGHLVAADSDIDVDIFARADITKHISLLISFEQKYDSCISLLPCDLLIPHSNFYKVARE